MCLIHEEIVTGRDTPLTLGLSMESIKEMSDILIFADINELFS